MVNHFKGDPSRFIIKYSGGKVRKSGPGLSFFYLDFKTNIAAVPATTIDSNFIFNEVTKNYQNITLQGHFTYQIKDPLRMAALLNFTINPETGAYLSEDPEKLELRLRNTVQMATRHAITRMDLEEALAAALQLADTVYGRAKEASILQEMGIDLLTITFTSIKPTPEIAKALEADYREALQKKADEAIYQRRAAAVEQERAIKENELNNQIALEKKREKFIALEGANQKARAEVQKEVTELELAPYKEMDPRTLIALALQKMGQNTNIQNLTITSEILASLLGGSAGK